MPAYFLPGEGPGPRPTAIFVCGLDTTKELWFLRARRQFADRGISSLFIDTPGIGEALRLRKMVTRADYEKPIAAAIDFLQSRSDVNSNAIGLIGSSLGGYYVARAAAFLLTGLLPAGVAQRLAFALWFGWLVLAGSRYGSETSPV